MRKVNIYASSLTYGNDSEQLSFFDSFWRRRKIDAAETVFFDIRRRYGEHAICTATQLLENKLPTSEEYQKMTLPKYMFH